MPGRPASSVGWLALPMMPSLPSADADLAVDDFDHHRATLSRSEEIITEPLSSGWAWRMVATASSMVAQGA